MILPSGKKIYFASDFHLGVPSYERSLIREKLIVSWLDEIKQDAAEIFLVGDVFDFWFEYKKVVPRGFVRLLGKLAEIVDSGIPIHYFTGNHDMWIFDYIPKETGVALYRNPLIKEFNNKRFYIAHGDGLGPGDTGYKVIKKIFSSQLCQKLFSYINPRLGMKIANYWSGKSRVANGTSDEKFLGEEREMLILYCKELLVTNHFNYFVFGHRHLPLDISLKENSRYINLGDWIKYNSYAVFDGNEIVLKYYKQEKLV